MKQTEADLRHRRRSRSGRGYPGRHLRENLQSPGLAPECLQRLSVNHPRWAHFSEDPPRPRKSLQHGRPPGLADPLEPGVAAGGVALCALPVSELAEITRNKVAQNTLAVGAGISIMGIGFQALKEVLTEQFKKKGEAVASENVGLARVGYDYATANFRPFAWPLPTTGNRYAVLSGNVAMAMGGAAAGVKFYCAYPMSPSTGVLHWMAAHAHKAGIMVRQVEDEIGVVNMAIGAAHSRRQVHVRYVRWRLCIDERRPRPLSHDGNAGGGNRLPAGRSVHGSSNQDRARRPLANAGRCVGFVADEVLSRMHALISVAHFKSVDWNPIQVYDFMVSSSDAVDCPYGFGYSNYSRIGSSPRRKEPDGIEHAVPRVYRLMYDDVCAHLPSLR
jgi:hypothetical protein